MTSSKLAENVVVFTRLLRAAGLRLGTASALDAAGAAAAVDLRRRGELYWALHAALVRRPEERALFDQAFSLFWRDPDDAGRGRELMARMLPQMRLAHLPTPPAISRRLAEAWRQLQPPPPRPPGKVPERAELDAALSFSPDELLRSRDFEQMTAAELARAKRLVARLQLTRRPVRTRRYAPDPHGPRIDLARTARDSRTTLGDLAPLRWRSRIERPPPLVVLCDVSGSMGRYAEMLLCFLHALLGERQRTHAFLFATRLTPVTRLLRRRDADEALARCGREVADWAGGTRLRGCLRDFNRTWSRRVLGQGAVVLLVTDGLDRDPEAGLAAEADRLHRSCRRLIWLNPLLRWAGFSPRAAGVRALLPHVDEHRPVHNLDSLEALGRALEASQPPRRPPPPTTRPPARTPPAPPERTAP